MVTEGGTTFTYRTPLLRLTPGVHRYRISSEDETFKDSLMIREPNDKEQFIFIGDIQDQEKGKTAAFFNQIRDRFSDADAWLFAGDLIERGHHGYWEIFYDAVRDFAPHTVFLPTAGNHEYTKGLEKRLDPRWMKAFPKKELIGGMYTYYVDYSHARFISIDTNTLPYGLPVLIRWLRKALTDRRDAPFLIVMMHHGVKSPAKGRLNLIERLILGPILKKYGADLVLQGHDHVYARWRTKESVPLYLTSTTSFKSYGVKSTDSDITVSQDHGRFYVVLDLSEGRLSGKVYREDHTLFDHFTKTKQP